MSKSNENVKREESKILESCGLEIRSENPEKNNKSNRKNLDLIQLDSGNLEQKRIVEDESQKKEEQKEVLKEEESSSLFSKTLFRDEPDIQIQELEDAHENLNPLSDSLYSGRTPRSGESINFKNLISSDLMRRIEEGSPIKIKKTKKLSEKDILAYSEEEDEGKLKEKEQHSLFYKNNPQWKISNESLNYIQQKETSNAQPLIRPNENFQESDQNFENEIMKMNQKYFNDYELVSNNEKKCESDNLANVLDTTIQSSPKKEFLENNLKIEPYKDGVSSNYTGNFYFQNCNRNLKNVEQYNWNQNLSSIADFNNFNDNQVQDSLNNADYENQSGTVMVDYRPYTDGHNLRTPFNSSEKDGSFTPQKSSQPHITFEEFLKIKYQGRTPPKYNFNKIDHTFSKNYFPSNKVIPNSNQQFYKKESPHEDYDYCSSSTHSTITKKLSPFEDVSFYPKNFYSFTPNIKNHNLLRTDEEKTNFLQTPEEKGSVKGDHLGHGQFRNTHYFLNNNIGSISNNNFNILSPKANNLKNLNKFEKLNESNFNLRGMNQNNSNHPNFSIGRFYPGQSPTNKPNTNNFLKSKTIPGMIYTKPQTSSNPCNIDDSMSVNNTNEDCSKSPLSVNLNINKIKKNANINNLTNLSSNLAKLTSNISDLNNLSNFSNNLPNFENISELNKLIELNNPHFIFDKESPPKPSTPQNTPQYRNFQNGKTGWICSSCKNFNYESKFKF
jgi:hypothetical protein